MDWWRHGPKLRYTFDFNDDVRWKSSYQFQLQLYDEEPAGDSSGSEIGTPDEEHFFHTARTSLEWQISDQVVAEVELRFRQKDDRFEDFEVKVTFDLTAVVLQFDKARDAYIAESND